MNGLLSRIPVAEVRLRTHGVLDYNILGPLLQSVGPCKDTLNACRVWRDNAHCGEACTGGRHILIHCVEPFAGNLPRSRPHVGGNDRRARLEMIYKRVEAGWRVNIDLGY